MNQELEIIVIDPNDATMQTQKALLKEIKGVRIVSEAKTFAEGYKIVKKHNPSITILNIVPPEEEAFKLAEKISQNMPGVFLFATSAQSNPEIIIRAMRAGAREYFIQPFKKNELQSAINSIFRFQELAVNGKSTKGKVITVFGAKGGVGTTTVATNTAVALKEWTNKDVIIVDLNLKFGNAALFLNIKPKYSIIDVANNITNIDTKLLKNSLPKHSSGVCLLASPLRPEEAESIASEHIDRILEILRDIFDYIVIDSNNSFDEVNIKALDESDTILSVSNLELACIYNAKKSLALFKRMGFDQGKVLLVLNRVSTNNSIENEILEKSIDYPTFWKIPNQAYLNVLNSINQGTPITQMMPRSKLGASIFEMVHNLNGDITETKSDHDHKSTGRLFKKLLKK